MSSSFSPDWSLLPDVLLADILRRLHSFKDFCAARAVCRNWRSLVTPSSVSPLILFNPKSNPKNEYLYDIAARRFNRHPIPWHNSSRHTVTYSHNHLVTVVELGYYLEDYLQEIIFVDLFTLAEITLPVTSGLVERILLSARPDAAHCLVVLFSNCASAFKYIRVGDSCWTHVIWDQYIELESFRDLVFFQGDLLAVNEYMEVFVVELMGDSLRFQKLGGSRVVDGGGWINYKDLWLGELDGVMLAVAYYHESHPVHDWFVAFLWDSEKNEWKEIQDFGDRAVFFSGRRKAVLVSTRGLQLRNNCIYRMLKEGSVWFEYSLEDKFSKVVQIDDFDGLPQCSVPPIWISPNQ